MDTCFVQATIITSHFIFFFYCYGDHRDLHSFPTRRSSDLWREPIPLVARRNPLASHQDRLTSCRSEEHTSELQSRFDLVCRLLLEKKKNIKCPSLTLRSHRTTAMSFNMSIRTILTAIRPTS